MNSLSELHQILTGYSANDSYQDESLGLICCKLALQALDNECYGVGALLFDNRRKVITEARNEIFQDGFHSAAHAEMLAIDRFEANNPVYLERDKLTLMVSLEPCPMCLTRLLLSGIGRIIYLAKDKDGGMVHQLDQMPPSWRNLAEIQTYALAEVSPALSELASRLASCQLNERRQQLMKTIRG